MRKRPRLPLPHLDLTPCSDIIFTLLLFYILTQSFITTLPIALPTVTGPLRVVPANVHKVEVQSNGEIFFHGEKTDQAGLQTLLDSLATKGVGSAAFLVLADRKSPAGVSIEILDLIRRSGFSHAGFAGACDSGRQPPVE